MKLIFSIYLLILVDHAFRGYYFYEFGVNDQRLAVVAAVNSGKVLILPIFLDRKKLSRLFASFFPPKINFHCANFLSLWCLLTHFLPQDLLFLL